MHPFDLEQAVLFQLNDFRVSVAGSITHGNVVTLSLGHDHRQYEVCHSQDPATIVSDLLHTPGDYRALLVISDFIGERPARRMRDLDIQYLDACGNSHLRIGESVIEVRGRRLPTLRSAEEARRIPGARAYTPKRLDAGANLFSSKRAQVGFALLCWPKLLQRTIREIADASRVSVGAVHNTLDLLSQAGFVTDGERNWLRPADLMTAWLATYPTGLGSTLKLAEFRGDPTEISRPNDREAIFVGGESSFDPQLLGAADPADQLIRGTTMTLYVNTFEDELAIINRWRADPEPNIFIRRKFWEAPQGQDGPLGGLRAVPRLLIAADLFATGEPRQREIAQRLLEEERARLNYLR